MGTAATILEVGGYRKACTRTEDGMEGARQGAEGESSKEGADLLWGRQGNQVSPGVNEEVLLSSGPVLVRLRPGVVFLREEVLTGAASSRRLARAGRLLLAFRVSCLTVTVCAISGPRLCFYVKRSPPKQSLNAGKKEERRTRTTQSSDRRLWDISA